MPTPLIILIVAVLLLTAFFFGFTYFTYSIAFKRKKKQINLSDDLGIDIKYDETVRAMINELASTEYEEVSITSFDGLTLKGRYYHVKDGAPIELFCHGYRSSPVHDFSGGATAAIKSGVNALMIYQRAHGKSEGKAISFGAKERLDVAAWAEYLTRRFGEKTEIVLCGISMGAATVLLASALELPKSVKCVVADCPYSSARDILMLTAKRMGYPERLVYPFIRLGAKIYGGFDPEDANVSEAVRHSRLPIFLVHGEADSFVPKYMSDKIYENRQGEMYYYTFPNADHGLSYIVDTERYQKLRLEFTSKYISYEGASK